MGQYKVPQDVEAEDKLIGPLSLRQFIYIIIAFGWAGLMYALLRFNIVIMVIAILPITGFFLLLGLGRRQEQSFENYFVAFVKFMFVPRVRLWDKDLTQEQLIKMEVKPPEVIVNKNVSKSSLQQLALVMDTHGMQKDPTIQLQDDENIASTYGQRVINPSQIAQEPGTEPRTQVVTKQDDVLDQTNPHNTDVGELLENVETNIHDEALKQAQQGVEGGTLNIPKSSTKPMVSNDILKKAMLQSDNLTVEQIAREAKADIMTEGQSVKISPST